MERYKLQSPSVAVHQRAKTYTEEHGKLFVNNERRLSLSVGVDDPSVLHDLEIMGVKIVPDVKFDAE